ncbi:MAG: hypothetical protein Q7T03_00895 [Deltaproteobacteria bacterium]|nr:hypothetical protein [Deltaproteobacteria bacterium]
MGNDIDFIPGNLNAFIPFSCGGGVKMENNFSDVQDLTGDFSPEFIKLIPGSNIPPNDNIEISPGTVPEISGGKEKPDSIRYDFNGSAVRYTLGGKAYNVQLKDIDGDGDLDIVYSVVEPRAVGDTDNCRFGLRVLVNMHVNKLALLKDLKPTPQSPSPPTNGAPTPPPSQTGEPKETGSLKSPESVRPLATYSPNTFSRFASSFAEALRSVSLGGSF